MSTSPTHQLLHPQHADRWRAGRLQAHDVLDRRLADLRGPSSGCDPEAAEARVRSVDLDRPLRDLAEALVELDEVWLRDAVWFHDPAYAAHLNCPVLIPAVVADALASAVNTSMDTFDQSVGATFVERSLIDWVAGRIGWHGPQRPDGVLTSGGTQSNLQGLMLARETARSRGVRLDDMVVLCSTDAHFSVQTSTRLLGLAPDAVVPVALDGRRRMDPAALEHALAGVVASGRVPVAVVATAGTTDFGAIDPIGPLAAHARRHRAWLHVDAAYGGGLLVSPRHRHRLAGIELADSVTVDFHKTWFQPVACSALLVADAGSLRHVAWHADYLNPAGGLDPNQVDKSLQTTRRFDALKLWLSLRTVGADGIGALLDDVVDLTAEVHDVLRDRPGIEIAVAPELTTLVWRCRPAAGPVEEESIGALNREVRATLRRSGSAMVAATRIEGRQFLKLTLLNPLATRDDIVAIVDRARGLAEELVDSTPLEAVAR